MVLSPYRYNILCTCMHRYTHKYALVGIYIHTWNPTPLHRHSTPTTTTCTMSIGLALDCYPTIHDCILSAVVHSKAYTLCPIVCRFFIVARRPRYTVVRLISVPCATTYSSWCPEQCSVPGGTGVYHFRAFPLKPALFPSRFFPSWLSPPFSACPPCVTSACVVHLLRP